MCKQAYMAVFDEDFLNNYNEKKEYGYSDWEKGVAKDIINKEDLDGEVTHPLGEVTYSNYKLTADQKLYVIGKDEFSDSRDEEADKAEETRRKANDIDLNYWYE